MQLKVATDCMLQYLGLKVRLEILLIFWFSYKKAKKLELCKLLKASAKYTLKKSSL